MKKSKTSSRHRQKKQKSLGWILPVAVIVVVGLLGWYAQKQGIFAGADASTLTGNTLQELQVDPTSISLAEGQSTYVNATVKGLSASAGTPTYRWINDAPGTSVGVKTTLSNTSSGQVRVTAVSAPNNGGWSLLKVVATFGNTTKEFGTTIRVSPRKIASAQITSSSNYFKMAFGQSLTLNAKSFDEKAVAMNNAQVQYKWRIQNGTATAAFHDLQSTGPSVKIWPTNPSGGHFIVFMDATYRGTTVSAAQFVSVIAKPTLESVVITPKMGTYFSGKTYTFTAQAFDSAGNKTTATYTWTTSGIPSWAHPTTTQGIRTDGSAYLNLSMNLDPNRVGWAGPIYVKATSGGISKSAHTSINLMKNT